jgi:hypothetical protein
MPFLVGTAPQRSAPCVTPWRATGTFGHGSSREMF